MDTKWTPDHLAWTSDNIPLPLNLYYLLNQTEARLSQLESRLQSLESQVQSQERPLAESLPITGSSTTGVPSAAPDNHIPAVIQLSRLLLGDLTGVELTHAAQCSQCRGHVERLPLLFKMHALAAAGRTSTSQSQELQRSVDRALGVVLSPSSESSDDTTFAP